jgi:hypothetical protein
MKTLSLEQMETVKGGSMMKVIGCTMGSVLLLAAFGTLFALTAGAGAIAIASAAVGASLTPASWGLACFTDY